MATMVAEIAVSTPLYTAVMNVLKVPTDAVSPFPELTEFEAHQLLTLTQQLIDCQQLLETLKQTHTERPFRPITELPCTVTDRLYGLRMQRPLLETTAINVFSLTALHARRFGIFQAQMSLEVLFLGLKEHHLSYSRTETELYRGITVIHATATSANVDLTAVLGNTVTKDQADWNLVLALPRSQMGQFVRGELSMESFAHQQCNLWHRPRSALLRLVHMHWQEMELDTEENISLLVMNPLENRFSQGTVKTEPGTGMLYTFNRLWLDYCLTTGSVERFALEPTELETGMIFELQGLTLGALSALSTEMTCAELYGYHCSGLVGHLVLTVSQGKMVGLNTDDMSYQMQFETLGTAPTGAMNRARVASVPLTTDDDDDTDESTVDVDFGLTAYGRRITVEFRKRK